MNRILNSVNRMRDQIAERIAQGVTTKQKVEATRKALDMDVEEFCMFQELKSTNFLQGVLTLDEAQTVYNLLGGTISHFNGQEVAVKVVLTQMFRELLERKCLAG